MEYARQLTEEGLRFYSPHSKQLDFHQSVATKRGLLGGNQSGKSYAGGVEMAMAIGKIHPYRPNYTGYVFGRDCCVDFGVLQSVLIPTYKAILPRRECRLDGLTFEGNKRMWPGLKGGSWKTAWSNDERAIYLGDGSFIEFKSYEQGKSNPDSFAGPPRHVIRMDEEPPQRLYNENLMRQVTTGQNLLFTMTPLNYSQWVYSLIIEGAAKNEKTDCFKMASRDNPYANLEMLDQMEEDISDPIERAARLYGEPTYVQGRVWKEYGDHNLIDFHQIPSDWHRSIVIDPHPEKPTAVNWIAMDHGGNLFCYREADISGRVSEICDRIRVDSANEYIDLMLIDPSARASAKIRGQGSLIDEFRKVFSGIIEANNNREVGWDIVGKKVKDNPGKGPSLFVMRNCPLTDFQMRNYSWKPPTMTGEDRKKPDVVKRNDDHCDNIRYRCMASWANNQPKFTGFNVGGVYAS